MVALGMNIDHVATLRQARRTYEPDPVWAAVEAQLGGADAITVHLREDRRHIQDHDVERIRAMCQVAVNLEMAATPEMVGICRRIKPHMATLVPEGRQEVTTEGGLNVALQQASLREVVSRLQDAGVRVSAFIDAEPLQIDAAAACGFSMCEIHTGPYAEYFHDAGGTLHEAKVADELERIAAGGRRIIEAGMQFNAGHALNYRNVQPIAALPGMAELHIGHAIVSRAIFTGLRAAVTEMKRLIDRAAAHTGRT
jgi:pyridoxine 5-phosphate synthase